MAYITPDDARDYAILNGIDLPLSDTDTPEEPGLLSFLNRASRSIDLLYGSRYLGSRTNLNQPLYWPRKTLNYYDSVGNYRQDFNTDDIPSELQHATVILAGRMFNDSFDPFQQPLPEVTEETKKLDGLQITKKYATPYATSAFYALDLLLRPLLKVQLNITPKITMTRGA